MLDNETVVQSICDVLDIDYETIVDKLPADPLDSNAASDALMNATVSEMETVETPPDENGGGDFE